MVAKTRKKDSIKDRPAKDADEKTIINRVLELARRCDYVKGHTHQVTRIVLKLFDQLKGLHKLDKRYRILLRAGALLHDIGWVKGRIRHHKTARDIIMKDSQLPLTKEERTCVALLARYHRRKIPKGTHKYYSELGPKKKDVVRKLASLLRVADGMDRNHTNNVMDLHCQIKPHWVYVRLKTKELSACEQIATEKKADLFEDVFKKEFIVNWGSDN